MKDVMSLFLILLCLIGFSFFAGCNEDDSSPDEETPTPQPTITGSKTATPTCSPTQPGQKTSTPTRTPTVIPTSTPSPINTPINIRGERIFYTRSIKIGEAWFSDLYCIKPEGSNQVRITDIYPYIASEPCISKDGRWLSFSSNLYSFKSAYYLDIFKLNLSTWELTRVTGNERNPTTKRGSLVGLVIDDTGTGIIPSTVMVSYQGCDNFITLNDSWSFRFDRVPATSIWVKAVKSKYFGALEFVNVPEGGVANVVLKLTSGNFMAGQPNWSPDNSRLAGVMGFAHYSPKKLTFSNDFYSYYQKDPTGTPTPSYYGFDKIAIWRSDGFPLDDQRNSTGIDICPKYSPDGTKIAFCRGPLTQESIVIVPANNLNGNMTYIARGGFDIHTLTSYGFTYPAWSPDGRKLVCTYSICNTSLDFTGNLILINADGSGGYTQLTSVPRNATAIEACFSPDGSKIAYTLLTSKRPTLNATDILTHNYTTDIYIKLLTTGQNVRLTNDGVSSSPSWGIVNQ